MNIKNYTSQITATQSIGKIENMLVQIGATNINKQYKDKICAGITFLYFDDQLLQTIPFHLTADTDACFNILWKDVKRPQENTQRNLIEQANRTAWKIISDLIELQCSMIMLGQAKPLQMFLPYMYDTAANETLFEKVVNGKMKLLN